MKKTSTVVKQFVIDYTRETMDPLMEHEVNGLDYRYVYGLERLSVNISPIENGAGHVVEVGTVGIQIRLYYHQDLRGTVDYLTSPVSQKVESWTHYNEWGEITHNAVLKMGLRELDLVKNYTGHDYDVVLNLYYAKARMYDAENRRFMSVDPILDGSIYDISVWVTDPNMFAQYIYVMNNPLTYVDPDGKLLTEILVVMALTGVGTAVVSMLIEAGVEYATTGEIDLVKVGIAGAEGFAVGAISASPAGGVGVVLGTGAVAAVGSATRDVYTNSTGETDYSLTEIVGRSAISGASSAALSGLTLFAQARISGSAFLLSDGSTHNYLASTSAKTTWTNALGVVENNYLYHVGIATARGALLDFAVSTGETIVLDGVYPIVKYHCELSCNKTEKMQTSTSSAQKGIKSKNPSQFQYSILQE